MIIYHWDLPHVLEKEGGWTSPMMQKWFSRYVKVCAENFGSKIKNWIIINGPLSFTALGYMLGKHAPGKKGLVIFFLPSTMQLWHRLKAAGLLENW